MASSSPESSQELRYPPIRVNRSLARLDLNKLIMRSNARREPDEANSSLDESCYEVVSVSEASDDEGHTESLASIDDHTPDDVSIISDDDEYAQDIDASQHLPSTPCSEPLGAPLEAHQATSPDDSTLTELADMRGGETPLIKLEESPATEHNGTDAWAVIKAFDGQQGLPSILQQYGCPELRLTVHAALSKRCMPACPSFRILYIGSFPDWAEREINNHIGVALDASPGSSRFIQVRGQLEPYGTALNVDHCTTLDIQPGSSEVQVTLDDGTLFAFGPRRATRVQGPAPLPDLVIFCHPSGSDSVAEVEKFHLARDAFQQHQIGCLDISLIRPYATYPRGFGSSLSNLGLRVEGRPDGNTDFELQETLPIDHYTFINMDPSQLNRHLAFITPCSSLSDSGLSEAKASTWSIRSVLPGSRKGTSSGSSSEWLARRNMWAAVVALTAMLTFCLLGSAYIPGVPYNITKHGVGSLPSILPSPSDVGIISSIAASLPGATHDAVTSAGTKPPTIDLTTSLAPMQLSQLSGGRHDQEKASGFELEATHDHQFVLTPSKHFVNGKSKPQLQIQVFRNSIPVPVRYVRTLSGAYIVDLEQEYPLGNFNVSIATHSKPIMQQSFDVKLGSSRFTLSQLVLEEVNRLSGIVFQDAALVGHSAKNLSSGISKSLQGGAIAAFNSTRLLGLQIHNSTQTVALHLQGAKMEANRRLQIRSKVLREAPGATWMKLRKITAPVRTAPTVLKARRNALGVYYKLGQVVGLSKKQVAEQPDQEVYCD